MNDLILINNENIKAYCSDHKIVIMWSLGKDKCDFHVQSGKHENL